MRVQETGIGQVKLAKPNRNKYWENAPQICNCS